MVENTEHAVKVSEIQAEAKKVIEHGDHIREQTRDITLRFLTQGSLDIDRIKAVMRAVMEGAVAGSEVHAKHKEVLQEAISGLNDALGKSAEATKLAIEEAGGRVQDFAKVDLQSAVSDLRNMEATFRETLGEVVESSEGLSKDVLHDLMDHVRHSGSAIGEQTSQAIKELGAALEKAGAGGVTASTQAARSVSAAIAEAASGFLAGLADTLRDPQGGTASTKKSHKSRAD